MSDIIKHYGTPRHSGRYPWGSGKNPQRSYNFVQRVNELQKQGLSQPEIVKALGLKSTTQLRAQKSIAVKEIYRENVARAKALSEHGNSNVEIGKLMGVGESTVRNWLKEGSSEKADKSFKVAEILKEQVEAKKYLDIGTGVEHQLGVSKTMLDTSVAMLEEQGYKKQYLKVKQATNFNQETTIKVLTKADVSYNELRENRDKVRSIDDVFSDDNGKTFTQIKPPISMDPKRVSIVYKEDGGINRDGLIELNPNAKDLDLGSARYAQVRIAVNGTHYLKGMAMYGDPKDFPPGVDIRFNTNKSKDVPMMGEKSNSVLKPLEKDPDNPFGANIIRQKKWFDADGKEQQSPINIVNEDEDWSKWSKNLSSQMLSKQSPDLAKRQLKITYDSKKQEFDEISKLTNPEVKKKLLLSFADDCDSSAVHLKAAALPRQATHVILPFNSLKDNEIYAPNYDNGEEVVLVRYPHGGTFEMPRLTVNNNNSEAKNAIGTAAHAVGINHKVAQQLSGADFDGDTVVVIPTRGQTIKTSKPLADLEGFDPSTKYPAYEGMPKVGPKTGFNKQREMGKVSNLITDMTIKGAPPEDIAKAVKHSMVVIDAEKHNLDWRASAKDNDIALLKERWQGAKNAGASTLISRASSEDHPLQRKPNYSIDPNTGEKVYQLTGKTRTIRKVKDDGTVTYKTELIRQNSTKMAETNDARTLLSGPNHEGTKIEVVYADHANSLKALANKARLEYEHTAPTSYSPKAAKQYSDEVNSLKDKLAKASMNAPKERMAQLIANKSIEIKKQANPDMDRDEIKKLSARELKLARQRVGANKKDVEIYISDKEWEAIQAGAISNHRLNTILKNADLDRVKQLATPRSSTTMSASKVAKAKALARNGYTQKEIADRLGVSASVVNEAIN